MAARENDVMDLLIVDDHRLFADAMQHVFADHPQIDAVHYASDHDEALQQIVAQAGNELIVLMDLNLAGESGVDLNNRLRSLNPAMRTIFCTGEQPANLCLDEALLRASSFVFKTDALADIRACMDCVLDGGRYQSASLRGVQSVVAETLKLSEREGDVARLLMQGLRNAEIAAQLGVTDNTVKTHLKSIYSKLGARNRADCLLLLEKLRFLD
jgi:DNA-binding NarL/FixJ family response regulator